MDMRGPCYIVAISEGSLGSWQVAEQDAARIAENRLLDGGSEGLLADLAETAVGSSLTHAALSAGTCTLDPMG